MGGKRLKRQGEFWKRSEPLTAEMQEVVQILRERADELGHTPRVADIDGAWRVKRCFRIWDDAILAAGLPALKTSEQSKLRNEKHNIVEDQIQH